MGEMPVQSGSTESSPRENERKRKRDVLSCLDCRRRKLKCDRTYPACHRCVKGGNASSCTYQSFHGSVDENRGLASPSPEEREPKRSRVKDGFQPGNGTLSANGQLIPGDQSLSAQSNVIKSLEHRLATLESMLNRNPTTDPQITSSHSGVRASTRIGGLTEPNTLLFKGTGFRTQYYGPSNPTTLLAHFPEVRAFIRDAHTSSNLESVHRECDLADARLKESLAKAPSPSTTNLLDLVPDRPVADRLVNLYFDTFEMTYRIIHRPTFWRDYGFFWQSPTQAPPGFVPVLLLVMATVRCMLPMEAWKFSHAESTTRSQVIQWIRACDFWLTQQSQKHRFLAMYQVQCLRYLAAAACSLKRKEAYSQAEYLVTYFKAAGFHRDPILLAARCSVYEMEMRRRLWATVVEFELQASVDRGMPSSLTGSTYDCPPPMNINDENFVEQSVKLPETISSEEYTKTSYLDISAKSLPLRNTLCSLVNDPSYSLSFDEILKYDQEINEALQKIPRWQGHDTTQVSTLLDLQLRQFLLLIHVPLARRKDSSHCRYSRMACLETATHIINQHHKLISSDNFTVSLIRDDVYRAALLMCHNAFLSSLNPNDILFQGMLTSFSSTMDLAFNVLEERCIRRGGGLQLYWHVSAANGLVQSKLGNERIETVKLRATERVAGFYQRMLAFQEGSERPEVTVASSAIPSLPDGASTAPNPWFYGVNSLGFTSSGATGPMEYTDTFEYSDWTLDNFWPIDGQQIAPDLNFLA